LIEDAAVLTLSLKPLTPFAAEVHDLDLRAPLGPDGRAAIEAAMDQHAVLVFRGQQLDQDQQIAFARALGPLDLGLRRVRMVQTRAHRFRHEELADISNVTAEGEVAPRDHAKIVSNLANQLWHSDSSFQKPRAKYSMLYSVVTPQTGGDTEFADLRMAWEALPDWRKRQVEPLAAVHYALHSRFMLGDTHYTPEQRDAIKPAVWPLVQTDPRSGRKILFIGIHACEIPGMPLPEARLLLLDLLEHATQREFIYRHQWRVGDLVMWDNTATLHRGRHFDVSQRRELRRATTEEVGLSPEAESLAARGADQIAQYRYQTA
jgi:alpha-ketoglutarate-dependent 2,4-dichlorophenoxyacetate dioxygenase